MHEPSLVENHQVHILVVEDIAVEAAKLKHLLQRHYGRVSTAGNGVEALEIIRNDTPHLVLSDVNMPEMDGYALCHRLKSDAALASVPVILLTALTDPAEVVRGLECGARGFLTKPYEEGPLLARIQFTLANRHLCTAPLSAKPETGVEIFFHGRKYFIASAREQILDFLLSTYELAVRQNRELMAATDALAAKARELQRSNEELEQFASVASHDLQEPLRMISSYLALLESRSGERLDAKDRVYLHYATDGAKRLQQMIQDLFAYSRVSTRRHPFVQEDLGQVLADAVRNLEVAIREKHAVITTDSMPAAMVDASQFTQLLQNLIGNALKFTTPGCTPKVHVGCRQVGEEWQFSVSDNGIGIEPQHFKRIFNLFTRLHTRDEYPGTGIGLAFCKKIVEHHGGRIWLESKMGEGTTFYFSIPVGESPII